ncbi:MAG: threonine synthase [Candidatus Krumholzibacteriia bacterium]
MRYSSVQDVVCIECGRVYPLDGTVFTCPDCGPLAGTLDVRYDLEALRGRFGPALLASRDDPTLWRYHELLPVRRPEAVVHLPTGMTPLIRLEDRLVATLARELEVVLPVRLLVKDDTRLASGSTKDRASSVAVSHALELGREEIAAASTGNAASSVAMFAARAGLRCTIFAPASAPPVKLLQIRAHGARLWAVAGTYDQAFDLCAAYCRAAGCYDRNTATNFVLGEGKKTLALEIWEQLGYRAPDWVVVPVGDGCIIGGVHKGFHDLEALGLIARPPRLLGVQAEGSAALARAWRAGADVCDEVVALTLADSIAVGRPRDQRKALRAVRESGGAFVTVADVDILRAQSRLATRAGMLVEPAAAAALAGLGRAALEGVVAPDAEVVLLHTGHGLKDMNAVERCAAANPPRTLVPTADALQQLLRWTATGKLPTPTDDEEGERCP